MSNFFLHAHRSFVKYKKAWFLIGVCFLFTLLRLPSLIEPHWYADEGIYQIVGRSIHAGRLLYKEIWDNKPPFLYLLYAIVDGNLFSIKLLSLISGVFSVISFYYLSNKITKKISTSFFSTIFYVILFGSPLLEGNIANAENFMLFPTILSAYFLFRFLDERKNIYIFIVGLLLSISFITKAVAIFDFSAFLMLLIFVENFRKRSIGLKPMVLFILSFLSLLLIAILYFTIAGSLGDFLNAVFFQNVSYVGDQNKLFLPMGILIIKTIVLVVSIGAVWYYSRKNSIETTFIYLWSIFSIYNAFFSERPYIHYLLVILPSFILLLGHIVENKKTKIIDGILLSITVFFALYYFQLYPKPISYYANYISFVFGNKKIVDYQTFFDKNTPRDYDVSSFIDSNLGTHETIFLWSDSPQIYALSNTLPISKYIVAYHITFYKDADVVVKKQIDSIHPRYIIQTIDKDIIKDALSSYQLRFIMEGARIYEKAI